MPTNDPAFFNFTDKVLTYNETTRTPVNLFSQSDVLIDPDDDGGTLQWITIEIVAPNIDPSDMLAADALDTGLDINPNAGPLLNISGEGSFMDYDAVLGTVMYFNNFPGINISNRTIHVITFDGMDESFVHTITINVVSFDDQPMCYFNMLVRLMSIPLI